MPAEAQTSMYDVFISYSHANGDWVNGWLVPRLERAGLRVCIDHRDFDVGVASLSNIERAVETSHHTLLVMSPAWIESEWAVFESLLAQTLNPTGQRRIVPLLLEPCQPPRRLAMLTYADCTQPEKWESQIGRIVAALQGVLNFARVSSRLQTGSSIAHSAETGAVPVHLVPSSAAHEHFTEALLKEPVCKALLGMALIGLVREAMANSWSIYFGPGTTVYTLYGALEQHLPDLHSYQNVGTSNPEIAALRPGTRLVGDVMLGEYPSYYYSSPDMPTGGVEYDVSIIGFAGVAFPLAKFGLEFRTCWQEQSATVNQLALRTLRVVVIVGDYTKLSTSNGHPFLTSTEMAKDCATREKIYRLIISGVPHTETGIRALIERTFAPAAHSEDGEIGIWEYSSPVAAEPPRLWEGHVQSMG